MAYQYTVYTPQGMRLNGRLEAGSETAAEELLWKQNYTIVSLKESQDSASIQLFSKGKIRTRDLIVFSRQLAQLIESGIPIVRALTLLQDQMTNKRMSQVLAEITTDVQQGKYFSEAIAKHGTAFPSLYARLIEVGEKAGNLEIVLRQLASYIEKEEALVRKVRGAMAYPSFVLLLAIGVVFLMLTVALPPLMSMFDAFGADLPLPTRMLIALTNFFSQYKFQVLGGVLLVGVSALLFTRTEPGRKVFDRVMLKVPLIGRVIVQSAVARMCQSISALLRAGIALPEILELSTRTQSNCIIRHSLEEVHSELMQGHGFADPLGHRKIFPSMLVQMVRVGEETGALDANMDTLAVFYEGEVDRTVNALTAALEPALTIFIGVLVGFVAVAVIMPMYSLMGQIK